MKVEIEQFSKSNWLYWFSVLIQEESSYCFHVYWFALSREVNGKWPNKIHKTSTVSQKQLISLHWFHMIEVTLKNDVFWQSSRLKTKNTRQKFDFKLTKSNTAVKNVIWYNTHEKSSVKKTCAEWKGYFYDHFFQFHILFFARKKDKKTTRSKQKQLFNLNRSSYADSYWPRGISSL